MLIPFTDQSLEKNSIPHKRGTLNTYRFQKVLPEGTIRKLQGKLFLDTDKYQEWLTDNDTKQVGV